MYDIDVQVVVALVLKGQPSRFLGILEFAKYIFEGQPIA